MIEKLFDLSGRVAIVTGGSRGLGAEFAEGLAEAGASVMLCARRDEWLAPGLEQLRGRGFEAEAMRCDVSNAADVEAVVHATVERFGKIDILVNNAGVSWGERPETMMLAQWQKVVDVNLTGAFICSQSCGTRDAEAPLRTNHQYRVDCGYAGKCERPRTTTPMRRAKLV
jgi:gluconate 5-dehydrogenase